MAWLKKMMEKVGLKPEVLKLSGGCSADFKSEAMLLFQDRLVA